MSDGHQKKSDQDPDQRMQPPLDLAKLVRVKLIPQQVANDTDADQDGEEQPRPSERPDDFLPGILDPLLVRHDGQSKANCCDSSYLPGINFCRQSCLRAEEVEE